MNRSGVCARALIVMLALSACVPNLDRSATQAAPTPASGARSGGTLRIGTSPPETIDPGQVADPASALIVSTMCDQLVVLDPRTGEPRPGLATSWTFGGARKLFVRLRPDARFTDGSPLTAEDVVFSLSRLASQDLASASASLLASIAGYRLVHGDEETANDRLRKTLAGVGAADPHTVEITLDERDGDFLRVLAHPATSPVSKAAAESDARAFERSPVCVGPYVPTEPFARNTRVTLERSAGYDGWNGAYTRSGAGYPDEIVFVPTDDPARAFRRGRVDVAPVTGSVPAAVRDDVVRAPGGRVELIGLPTSTAPFDDPLVRRAFSRALDRRRFARNARIPATGFLPPTILPDHHADACGEDAPVRGDVRGARALLADADIDLSDTRIDLIFNDEFGNRDEMREVARQWERAFGVRVRLRGTTWESFLQHGQSTTGFTAPFRFSWEPEIASSERMLVPLFDDSSIGVNNLSRFDSLDFADALDAARAQTEDPLRRDGYRLVETIVCAQMPMLPLTVDVRRVLVRGARIASAIDAVLARASGDPVLREMYIRS